MIIILSIFCRVMSNYFFICNPSLLNSYFFIYLGWMSKIEALWQQRNVSAAGIGSTVGESSPTESKQLKQKMEESFEPLGLKRHIPMEGESHREITPPLLHEEFHIESNGEAAPNVEHQFIPSSTGNFLMHENNKHKNAEIKNLAELSNRCEEISVSLNLGEPEPKRRKQCDSLLVNTDLN